jgi:hypothetical protein
MKYIEMTDEDTLIMHRIAVKRWSEDRELHMALRRRSMDMDIADSVTMSLIARGFIKAVSCS